MFPVIMPAACSDEELRILRGEQEVDEDRINDDMGNGDEDEDGSDDEDVRAGAATTTSTTRCVSSVRGLGFAANTLFPVTPVCSSAWLCPDTGF